MLISRDLIRISRPRFWMYTIWPVLIALAVSWRAETYIFLQAQRTLLGFLLFAVVFFFVLFPSNLLIYGVNDIADYETDLKNAKKQGYEKVLPKQSQRTLLWAIFFWNWVSLLILSCLVWYLVLAHWFVFHSLSILFYLLFLVFSIGYSLPPIRAKAIPFLDWLFNVLYILPWVAVYIGLVWGEMVVRQYVLAWWLWCIAMHTYSAIPDIEPDRSVWITTTAVFLWKKTTILYCWLLWLVATFLVERPLGSLAYVFWWIYIFLLFLSRQGNTLRIYKYFPRVNACIGFILFWFIVLYG